MRAASTDVSVCMTQSRATGAFWNQSNGLGILPARPASSQGWGHQAHLPRRPTGAEATRVERC
jgi:hypothetical protein